MPKSDAKDNNVHELNAQADSTSSSTTLAGSIRAWLGKNHGHVYGIIGTIGVVLAVVALFLQVDSDADVHLKVDEYTRTQVEQNVREYRTAQSSAQSEPSPHRLDVKPEEMPDAISNGFRIVKHEVVADFKDYRDLESIDLTKPGSAVVQHVKHQVLKVAEASTFNASAITSGLDVFIQSHSPMAVYASDNRGKFGPYSVRRRIIEFDVSEYPVGTEFTLQHKKTYWNAFQGEDQSWAGYEVRVPTDEIEYLIIFPENRPFREIEFFANDSEGNRRRLNREAYVLQDENNTWLWWRAVKPEPGISYNIDWEW